MQGTFKLEYISLFLTVYTPNVNSRVARVHIVTTRMTNNSEQFQFHLNRPGSSCVTPCGNYYFCYYYFSETGVPRCSTETQSSTQSHRPLRKSFLLKSLWKGNNNHDIILKSFTVQDVFRQKELFFEPSTDQKGTNVHDSGKISFAYILIWLWRCDTTPMKMWVGGSVPPPDR